MDSRTARIIRRLALAGAGLIAAAALAGPASAATALTKDPYVLWPSQTGITVMFEADANATITVSYSTDLSYGQSKRAAMRAKVATGPDRYLYAAVLTGLAAGTTYNYRVNCGTNPTGTFTTDPAATPASFSFIAYGDNRTYPAAHRNVAEHFTAHSPAFILNVGDITANGETYSGWKTEYFDPLAGIIDHIPVWPARGNHEQTVCTTFRRFFDFAAHTTTNYYSYDYASVHVTVLDSRLDPWDFPAEMEQMRQWCAADLAGSSATWKVVMYHKPSYNASEHDDPWGRDEFVPLFHQNKVDLVFTGHAHLYERFKPMSSNACPANPPVTYFVTGGGGAELHPTGSHPFLAYTASRYEYVAVTIEGKKVTLSARGDDGAEFDSASWTKDAAGMPDAAYLAQVQVRESYDPGAVTCTLGPAEAAAAGARWRLTSGADTAWKSSGDVIANVPTGAYTLTFKPTAGWTRPADQAITVTDGAVTSATGVYLTHLPPEAIAEADPGLTGTILTDFWFHSSLSHAHDGYNIASYQWEIDGVPASTAADFHHTFAAPGTYSVKLTVTDDAEAPLSDEDTLTIVVGPAPAQPDLVVLSLTHAPASPLTGELVTFTVKVQNQGLAAAGTFTLGFWSNRSTEPTAATVPQLSATVTGGLASGETKTVEFDVTASAAGSFLAWAFADRTDAVVEADETNNAGPAGGHAWTATAGPPHHGGGGGGGGGGCALAPGGGARSPAEALGWALPYLALAALALARRRRQAEARPN